MRIIAVAMLPILSFNAYANVIQFFTGISYSNPAELFQTKDSQLILGGTALNAKMRFNGLSLNANTFGYEQGVARFNTTGVLPYGRLAHRISDRLVLGLDVTEPYFSKIDWGNDSVLRYVSTQTLLTDIDISPRASWSVSKSLYIGGGLNFNQTRNAQVNFAYPVSPTQYGNLVNKLSSYKLGYDLGAYYVVNPTNYVGLSYFSALNMRMTGTSQLDGTYTDMNSSLSLPATTVLSYTHMFSQAWLTNWQVFYSDWSNVRSLVLNSTAAGRNFNFQQDNHGSVAVVGAVRHQYSAKLGLTLIGVVDTNPASDALRGPGLPSDNQYFLAIAADYQANRNTSFKLTYGRGVSNPLISTNFTPPGGQPSPLTFGRININAQVIDLQIKITA